MTQLLTVHSLPILISTTAAGNFVLAVWAFVAGRSRRTLGRSFWLVLLLVLAVLAMQVAAGIVLALGGARPQASLHWLYGILVSAGAAAQFGLRPGGFLRPMVARNPAGFREARFLALLCLTEGALILRAFQTGMGR